MAWLGIQGTGSRMPQRSASDYLKLILATGMPCIERMLRCPLKLLARRISSLERMQERRLRNMIVIIRMLSDASPSAFQVTTLVAFIHVDHHGLGGIEDV